MALGAAHSVLFAHPSLAAGVGVSSPPPGVLSVLTPATWSHRQERRVAWLGLGMGSRLA